MKCLFFVSAICSAYINKVQIYVVQRYSNAFKNGNPTRIFAFLQMQQVQICDIVASSLYTAIAAFCIPHFLKTSVDFQDLIGVIICSNFKRMYHALWKRCATVTFAPWDSPVQSVRSTMSKSWCYFSDGCFSNTSFCFTSSYLGLWTL